jgi:ferredoxin--NADP+ reductase/benzoate/toluate 1,2-dioxygenase reductase subunit
MVQGKVRRVHHVRSLDESTFVLRFDRHDLLFEPGQYVNLGVPGTPGAPGALAMREYSVYSGAGNDYLEVLVKEIPGGLVSSALRRCRSGDPLVLDGPYGLFVTDPVLRSTARYLFVGTGTGISPFHCFVCSFPGTLDYMLLHGVRTADQRHDHDAFEPSRRIACVSGGPGGDYRGRVTSYLRQNPVEPDRLCYLCGNSDMIYEAFAILRGQGVPREHLFAEVYF